MAVLHHFAGKIIGIINRWEMPQLNGALNGKIIEVTWGNVQGQVESNCNDFLKGRRYGSWTLWRVHWSMLTILWPAMSHYRLWPVMSDCYLPSDFFWEDQLCFVLPRFVNQIYSKIIGLSSCSPRTCLKVRKANTYILGTCPISEQIRIADANPSREFHHV